LFRFPDCFLGENPVNSRSFSFLIPVFSTHMIDFRIAISVICRIHGVSRIFASTGRFSQKHGLDKLWSEWQHLPSKKATRIGFCHFISSNGCNSSDIWGPNILSQSARFAANMQGSPLWFDEIAMRGCFVICNNEFVLHFPRCYQWNGSHNYDWQYFWFMKIVKGI
jgi:hypothetical protein